MAEKDTNLRALSDEELHKRLSDSREELMKFRFQQSTGELTDFTQIRLTRRQIARLLTIMRERELRAGVGGEQ